MFLFILLLALGACKKDEGVMQRPDGFSVDVAQNVELPYAVTSKDEIVFDITISSKADVIIQQAILRLDDAELQTLSATANQIHLQYTYTVTSGDVGKSLIFLLTISDSEGKSVERDFTVYVQSAPADITVTIPEDAPSEIRDDEKADFIIPVVSENDISYIKTFLDQTEITSLTKETFDNPKEDDYHFEYQPTAADADRTLTFTIEVMDVLGNLHRQTYNLFVERSAEADFNVYYDLNIGAQFSTVAGPFFGASTGEVYVVEGSPAQSANIDLTTYFGSGAFHITSPTFANIANFIYTEANVGANAMANWPTRNVTFIKKVDISRADFDGIHASAQIEALYEESSVPVSDTSGGLANGANFVFRTTLGIYGILYVNGRSANANSGHLTVDVKIQK